MGRELAVETVPADRIGLIQRFEKRDGSGRLQLAVKIGKDGAVTTRRFEARETGVAAEGRAVGAAINVAANRVAAEVADWVAAG